MPGAFHVISAHSHDAPLCDQGRLFPVVLMMEARLREAVGSAHSPWIVRGGPGVSPGASFHLVL